MTHSVSTLQYRLMAGPVCLEPLRILDTRAGSWQNWQWTFAILGASHAVLLRSDSEQLTELLTCAPPPDVTQLHAVSAVETPQNLCVAASGLLCSVRLTPFSLHEGDALRHCLHPHRQFAFAFPATDSVGTPLTRIGWQIESEALTVETVHTYPEESRGIHSITVFRRIEEGA